jgi:hypothetical protein
LDVTRYRQKYRQNDEISSDFVKISEWNNNRASLDLARLYEII